MTKQKKNKKRKNANLLNNCSKEENLNRNDLVDYEIEIKYFVKCFKQTIRDWAPTETVSFSMLRKFLSKQKCSIRKTFEKIWQESCYDICDFSNKFKVDIKKAKYILISSGYSLRHQEWRLEDVRKDTIERDILSAETIEEKKDKLYSLQMMLSLWRADRYTALSSFFDRKSREARYRYNVSLRQVPLRPVCNRVEHKNSVFIILLIGICILCACYVSYSFFNKGNGEEGIPLEAQIVLSLFTLLVGVVTTFLAMKQNYKIDYHQERLSVLPIFGAKLLLTSKIAKNKDYQEMIKEISHKENTCYWKTTDAEDDIGILCLTNYGHGAAYEMELLGDWDEFENPQMGFFNINHDKYVIIRTEKEFNITCLFYDLYGNYYSQVIHRGNNITNDSIIDMNSEPPVLELRTSRLRYVQ